MNCKCLAKGLLKSFAASTESLQSPSLSRYKIIVSSTPAIRTPARRLRLEKDNVWAHLFIVGVADCGNGYGFVYWAYKFKLGCGFSGCQAITTRLGFMITTFARANLHGLPAPSANRKCGSFKLLKFCVEWQIFHAHLKNI